MVSLLELVPLDLQVSRVVPKMPRAMDLLSSRPMVVDMERAKDFIAASLIVSLREERRRDRLLLLLDEPEEARRLPLVLP